MKTYTLTEQKADEFFKWLIDKANEQMKELTTTNNEEGDEVCFSLDKEQKEKTIEWVKDAFYEMCLKNGGVNE